MRLSWTKALAIAVVAGLATVRVADWHMPYIRDGASKVSDHWVRSPLLNVIAPARPVSACQRQRCSPASLAFRSEIMDCCSVLERP